MTNRELIQQLENTIRLIDNQIDWVTQEATQQPFLRSIYEMKTPSGDYVMLPLLVARANALASIANLKASHNNTVNVINQGKS